MNDDQSYVDNYTPPTPTTPMSGDDANHSAQPSVQQPPAGGPVSQSLADQNIFFLLGVEDGSDQEKEMFLDELQQVIWEDFLESDAELLLTEEELEEMKKIQSKKEVSDEQIQEDLIVFLEKLIPDLEEIMLEKALELKADMVRERIAGMKEYYSDNQSALAELDKASRLVDEEQWREAAAVMNAIPV